MVNPPSPAPGLVRAHLSSLVLPGGIRHVNVILLPRFTFYSVPEHQTYRLDAMHLSARGSLCRADPPFGGAEPKYSDPGSFPSRTIRLALTPWVTDATVESFGIAASAGRRGHETRCRHPICPSRCRVPASRRHPRVRAQASLRAGPRQLLAAQLRRGLPGARLARRRGLDRAGVGGRRAQPPPLPHPP